MNKKFQWNRFGKVLKKDIYNIWPMYGVGLLIITLIPLGFWMLQLTFSLLDLDFSIAPWFRLALIAVLVSLTGIIAPSCLYRTVNRPDEGIYFAMLPASKTEKYLSMVLVSGVSAAVSGRQLGSGPAAVAAALRRV